MPMQPAITLENLSSALANLHRSLYFSKDLDRLNVKAKCYIHRTQT